MGQQRGATVGIVVTGRKGIVGDGAGLVLLWQGTVSMGQQRGATVGMVVTGRKGIVGDDAGSHDGRCGGTATDSVPRASLGGDGGLVLLWQGTVSMGQQRGATVGMVVTGREGIVEDDAGVGGHDGHCGGTATDSVPRASVVDVSPDSSSSTSEVKPLPRCRLHHSPTGSSISVASGIFDFMVTGIFLVYFLADQTLRWSLWKKFEFIRRGFPPRVLDGLFSLEYCHFDAIQTTAGGLRCPSPYCTWTWFAYSSEKRRRGGGVPFSFLRV
ncbi:MAG: hypothetical protein ABEI52_05535 [Halobacteriaceae archaeon]